MEPAPNLLRQSNQPWSWHAWRFAYAWGILPACSALAWLLAPFQAKLRHSLRGRAGALRRLRASLIHRDEQRALIWFHTASVGEYLQASLLMAELAQHGVDCALTYTSVSVAPWVRKRAQQRGAPQVSDYLPPDSPGQMRKLLAWMRPCAVVYMQRDLWPGLIWEAQRAGTPQLLLATQLPTRSRRLSNPLVRAFYRRLYLSLSAIRTTTEESARNFHALCPAAQAQWGGDPRYDLAWTEREEAPPVEIQHGLPPAALTLVVGSAWPADAARILPGVRAALDRHAQLHVLWVPHELHPAALQSLETALRPFPCVRMSALRKSPPASLPRVLLVDAMGLLSRLYALGTLAYVGGGFGAGVHNVLEPAVAQKLVLCGPRHENLTDAETMLAEGWLIPVHSAEEFQQRLLSLLDSPEELAQLGARARAFVAARRGATRRYTEILLHACGLPVLSLEVEAPQPSKAQPLA